MIFLLILLIIIFTILGTVFLRKNTQPMDKLGLSLFLFNFVLLIMVGLSLQFGNSQPLKITLPSSSSSFGSISITQAVKNIFSKTYEPYKNEQIYTVGVDIDEGEYIILSKVQSETDFSVVSSDKKKLIASSSSWGNSYIELKSGMLLYIEQSKINELIPKKDVKPSSSYPKEEGTYFAGSTIEAGSYYVIKSDKAERTNISISGYTSFYNKMTSQSSAWRDGETIAFFNIKEGEGISFYDGLLYPLSDTTHIPKDSYESSGTFLGGTTLNSGNYYLTSTSDEQGYITKDDLYLFSDSQQATFIPEKSSSFYSVSDEDVISYRDMKIDNVSSAPKYKQSKSNGSFLGSVSIPIGWYQLNLQKDDDDTSELKLIDLTNNNYVSFYGSSYSSYYIYIDDTRAVTLTNISLTRNEPKIDNEAIDTWISDTIEPHLPLMEEISSSEESTLISSIYVDTFTQEESINYKDDNHTLSSSTKKDLLTSISLLSKETFLESTNFSENETNFVCNLPSDFTLRFIYQRDKDTSSKYIPGMPLPGHPNWYYNIFQN